LKAGSQPGVFGLEAVLITQKGWIGLVLASAVILGISTHSAPLYAGITFERVYSTPATDNGAAVRQTSGGGYYVAGDTDANFYLIKIDSLGDTLWSGTWGGMNDEWVRNARETQDGGCILVGFSLSFGPGGAAFYAVRVDSLGTTLWDTTYGGSDWDEGRDVETMPDGGFIFVGSTASFGAGASDVYLVRTDSAGDTLWTRTFGGASADGAYSVALTTGGGIIIAGETMSSGAGGRDFYLVKTDTLGNWLWERTYGGGVDDGARSVDQTSDGGFIVLGHTFSYGAGDADFYLVKTDSIGDTLWTATFGDSAREIGSSVSQTQDGGYIITGETESFGAGYDDLYLIRTDSLGNMVWDTTYGGTEDDEGRDAHQTPDGGFIVAGTYGADGSPWDDVYVLKLSPDGSLDWNDAGTVNIGAPPDTVYTNSMQSVVATVENFGNLPQTFDVTVTIDGYEDTIQVSGLAPDSTTQTTFSDWQVPATDSTTYVMTVCTHLVGDVDTSNDCFRKEIFAYDPTGILENRPKVRAEHSTTHLMQNKPNPFRSSTIIAYSLAEPCHVTVEVFDIAGRLLETLVDGEKKADSHTIQWNSGDRGGGIYFCKLTTDGLTSTRKMIVAD
jgi:hypothetical protein